jgi:hypothetical protein
LNRCIAATGYFSIGSYQVASKCPSICQTCTSFTFCNSCSDGYFLRNDNNCYSTCLASFYADVSSKSCKQCPMTCSVCLNASFCSVCTSGNFLRSDNMCYPTCLNRFYGDAEKLICNSCPYDCFTCKSDGTCLTCNAITDHREINSNSTRCVPQQGYFESNFTVC